MCRSAAVALLGALLAAASSGRAEEARCVPPAATSAPAVETYVSDAATAARVALEEGTLEGLEARLESAAAPAATAATLVHLARTWLSLGEVRAERARFAERRAAGLLAEAADAAEREGAVRVRAYANLYRGGLYAGRGRLAEARTLTRRALFDAHRAEAPDVLYRAHAQLGRIEAADGRLDAAVRAYRESVRLLDDLRAELAGESASQAFAFRSRVEPVYTALVDLLLRRAAAAADRAAVQADLREARNALESLKAAELRSYYGDPCLAAQRQTAVEEVPGTVVLYPVVLPDRVELIVSSAEGFARHRAPVDGPTLEATARRFRTLLTKRTTRQYRPLAERLYEWLIRPAVPSLEGRRIAALVVVPGGVLRTIPFAALRDPRSGLFLIEQLALAVAPGLTLTSPRPIDAERANVLAAGISESVQGYPPLASVRQEIADLEERFPGVVLIDEGFRAERFERELRSRPFGIVHVASHGEFRGSASESFVLAYDRRISMDQLAELVGRTRLRNEAPLELLALSACQTAAGDERAALGLAGVALRMGARSALATLWSVSDEASARLVTRFYAELSAGASRAEALRRAQRALLDTRAHRHPGYWAPFLLISSWL